MGSQINDYPFYIVLDFMLICNSSINLSHKSFFDGSIINLGNNIAVGTTDL